MNVFGLIASFRQLLAEREAHAQAEVLRAYEVAWKAIAQSLADLTRRKEVSSEEGASPSFRIQEKRLRELERQVLEAILDVGRVAADVAEREQAVLVRAAERQAVLLTAAKRGGQSAAEVSVTFDSLPRDVIDNLVGVSADGSPVRESFGRLARDLGLETGERVRDALVRGAALGQSPTEIARRVRREADAKGDNPARQPQLVRRLNSAVRTETYRALREASRATYEEIGVQYWRWVSALGPSTCAVCWFMHGKAFPVSVPMQSHIACRCTQIPVLDLDESFETGVEKFTRLEEGYQRQLLGDGLYNLYRAGKVQLSELVGKKEHPHLGVIPYKRSFKEVLSSLKVA